MSIYRVDFSPTAVKSIQKFKKSNPILMNKLKQIFSELEEHPRSGIGHPEPLVHGSGILYSRRLTAKDRVVYEIYDDLVVVVVVSVESHYNDK